MKTIAIFSTPQECGDATLNFVSLEDGRVVRTITMNDFYAYDAVETICHYKSIYEIKFYDLCKKQRWDIHDWRRHLHNSSGVYENKECTKRLRILKKYEDSAFTIMDCSKVGEKEIPQFSEPGKPYICGVWEYKAAVCEKTRENVYHPEQDEFMINLEKETGIVWPREERLYLCDEEKVSFIADKLGYEVLNILHY